MQVRLTAAAILGLSLVSCAVVLAQTQPPAPDFKRDVLPVLQKNCLKCHGPSQQQAGLRLDVRDLALKKSDSGAHAIVPHDANSSALILRVSTPKDDARMPPAYSGLPRLTTAEIATLTAWIDAGPSYGDQAAAKPAAALQWSLKPLRRPALPAKTGNPIDAFIHSKLAAKGFTPSPPADGPTLLRRVMYDLTGLPPTPAEVDSFVADKRPGAYERVVDRLLASPRYGERWARHWLDTVHFADSHGFEHDIGRDNAWPYRDYVIQSLNQDKPWARFVREQLAADYFYPDQPQLTPALGYLGAGNFDLSAYNTAPRNFELIDRDDMVTQTMSAFVSTTANCARCHNHKFDPIPQTDYYALQAVFSGLTKGDRTYDASTQTAAERSRLSGLIASADKRDPKLLLGAESQAQVAAWMSRKSGGVWQPVTVTQLSSKEGSTLTLNADNTITAGGTRPETDTYTSTIATGLRQVTALRLDVFASDKLPMHGPGRQDNGNLHLTELEVTCVDAAGKTTPVHFGKAMADFNQEGWSVDRAIDGDPRTAWGIYPQVGKSHVAIFYCSGPLTVPDGSKLVVSLHQDHGGGHLIGLYRLTVTDAPPTRVAIVPAPVEEVLRAPAEKRSDDQRLTLAAYVVRQDADAALAKLPPQGRVFAAGPSVDVPTVGMVTIPKPKPIFLLERGDINKPKEPVGPGALSDVTALPARFDIKGADTDPARRAALADWIADKNNPLTWRSVVNRVWQYHFGKGICDTVGDFGKMGGTPSHPELLDWLAVWLRDDAKGSLKMLHRLIVTSDTYRQSSAYRSAPARVDSDNRLLWRWNSQRLDADAYRDYVHAISGTLDLTMGGPSIKNFTSKPGPQLTPALDYAAYDWNAAGSGRRSIYRNVWRGIADPFMDALDFPDLGLLAPTRSFSVSALQALTLYNDAFVLHSSEMLARQLEKDSPALEAQVTAAVRRVWMRRPAPTESKELTAYAKAHGLPATCRILFNSNEFLFID